MRRQTVAMCVFYLFFQTFLIMCDAKGLDIYVYDIVEVTAGRKFMLRVLAPGLIAMLSLHTHTAFDTQRASLVAEKAATNTFWYLCVLTGRGFGLD